MKLTDEKGARALGWKRWRSSWIRGDERGFLPRYTTSLDAIVAEIEARGLGWRVEASRPNIYGVKQYTAWTVGDVDGQYRRAEGMDVSPAASLAQALMAFLKEPR